MVKYIKVKLNTEWMGFPEGHVLELNTVTANQLLSRESASAVEEVTEKKEAKEDKGAVDKNIASPPKDKMMESPVRQKRS